MLDNLYVLCKVWGFLKYYHPEVAKGKYNWDYELFKILPSIANAKNKEDRDKRLNEWVNKYGKVKDIEDYNYKMKGYPNYSKIINLDWIVNKDLFDERLISKLTAIKNAKRPNSFNYYTVPYQLRNWMPFDREKSYDNIKWDDQGFRILTLFRLWNIIEYCFPYYDLLEADWNSLLKEYIPGIVLPADKIKYELAIKELAGHINDSHGYMDIPDHSLEKTVLSKFYNKYRVPVELIETKNGDIVVKSSELSQFERGDVIIDLDGESVKDEIEQLVPYIMASNRSAMIRDILFFLLSSDKPSLCVTVLRNGQRKIINVQNFEKNQRKQGLKTCNDYKLEFKNIAYISNDNTAKMNEEIINSSINCKGIIVDLRPFDIDIGNQMVLISKILESPQSPLWISINNRNNPGNYSLLPISEFGTHNPKYYKGKIVILVDEHTQSHMESFAMIHRTAPNSIIIGSQTAGTNGAIGIVHLPHGIKFNYTCTGAYYPFWRQLQIKGVDIDVDVRPTTANIRDGRDIYIEKAIEYIVNRKIYEK
ncbi:hypothetical protein JGH11_18335 [Dysgonomonas sp. Marseille-P4677]|nr:hypothetical protein [Dysgonomonas sp. Marseille-P4677]